MWTLELLGTASITGPEGRVSGRAGQGNRLALLALLALARDRPVSRDKLMALLWPEIGMDRARPQLSNTLYILRAGLGEDVIRAAGDGLQLNREAIACDAVTFEELLDEGRLEAAVELFDGPLLDGFYLSAAAEFERWLTAERARLDQRYAAALESLAEAGEAQGQWPAAVAWWRKLSAHTPFSGRVAVRLMRALDGAGDRVGALQYARIHTALLWEEFETEPDPDVTAFAERLRLEPPARPAPETAPRPSAGERRQHETVPVATHMPRPATGIRRPSAFGTVTAAATLVMLLVGVYTVRNSRAAAPTIARSVGVLPFLDLGPDRGDPWFSDGLSEQIIAALSRIEGLQVAARTSSFALRDRSLGVRAIADTLGVEAILEGSVRREGNRLRVTAQLIDAATGYHLWSDEYDREAVGIFSVQDEIAAAIADALELRLSEGAEAQHARNTPALEAYDLYLRGLFLRNNLSADALRQAARHFDRALELEPGFALAWAAKASVVAPLIYFGHVPRDAGVAEMRTQVARALELDPSLGEAYAALGILRLFFDWDWDGAEQALRRAIALNPNDAHAWHHLANFFDSTGRFAEAIEARERSVQLDPLNARTRFTLGSDYLAVGNHERAIEEFRHASRLDPMHPLALGLGPHLPASPGRVYLAQGRHDEAVEDYMRIAILRNASARQIGALRSSYADSSLPAFFRNWLELDLAQSGDTPDPIRIAATWVVIGDTTQSLDWLERAWADRNPGLIYIRSEPIFAGLLDSPRLATIVKAMRFPSR